MNLLADALLILIAASWVLLIVLMFIGTAALVVSVAWDSLVAFMRRDAKTHEREDQIEDLEKLYRK